MKQKAVCLMRGIIIVAALMINSTFVQIADAAEGKALIAYYSRTGNTKMVCEALQKELGADLVEIQDLKNRMSSFGIIGGMFRTILGMHTKIEPKNVDLAPYSLVIFAAPIWASKVAPAMRTFVETNDLSGKNVAFFVTADSFLGDKYQQNNSSFAEASGGTVVGFYQVQAMDDKDGEKIPRPKENMITDTQKLAEDVKALMTK